MKNKITYFLLLVLIFGCTEHSDTPYLKSIKQFHAKRIERLKQPDSWLTLVGLYWLKEGQNSFGTDESNDIVFPKGTAPKYIGVFTRNDSVVSVKINKGIKVFHNDTLVTSLVLRNDMLGNPTVLKYGSLTWYIIKRADKLGVRLKDSESKLLKEFTDIKMFLIDPKWKIEAEFIEYDNPKTVEIPTAIGTVEKGTAYGKLKFQIEGKDLTLEPLGKKDELFLVFADLTNGEETYGAGRFLAVDKPDTLGRIFIDFNKAYNPPCVFTRYATCPLPTKENMLKIKVTAGEKNFHSAYH